MKRRQAPFKDERSQKERNTAKAFDALWRAEDNLRRALHRWDKANQKLRRIIKAADKKRAREADWRELQSSSEQIKDPDDWDKLTRQ